jgi:hypothetical protein
MVVDALNSAAVVMKSIKISDIFSVVHVVPTCVGSYAKFEIIYKKLST